MTAYQHEDTVTSLSRFLLLWEEYGWVPSFDVKSTADAAVRGDWCSGTWQVRGGERGEVGGGGGRVAE